MLSKRIADGWEGYYSEPVSGRYDHTASKFGELQSTAGAFQIMQKMVTCQCQRLTIGNRCYRLERRQRRSVVDHLEKGEDAINCWRKKKNSLKE